MEIEIQAMDFSLTEALQHYVNRRMQYAFSTRDRHIKCVIVKLMDINGPRGGNDKCCQIQVVLPAYPDVVVEDVEVDLYTAIDRAADRASRTVSRKVNRRRSRALQDKSLIKDSLQRASMG